MRASRVLRTVIAHASEAAPAAKSSLPAAGPSQTILVELDGRAVIEARGQDVLKLLHGLTSNDVRNLKAGSAIFTGFLGPTGRVICDAFVYAANLPAPASQLAAQTAETCVRIECDRRVAAELVEHLKKYRLRAKADFEDVSARWRAWALLGGQLPPDAAERGWLPPRAAFPDPRCAALGLRALLPASEQPRAPTGVRLASRAAYDATRWVNGVPEGAAEQAPGEALPLEANLDICGGVSFTKGCYLGQELTARTHHRGVVRKHLLPLLPADGPAAAPAAAVDALVASPGAPPPAPLAEAGAEVVLEEGGAGRPVGRLVASAGGLGFALVRVGEALGEGGPRPLLCGGRRLVAHIPPWWPPLQLDA
eukprot:tig00000101_g4445.t1